VLQSQGCEECFTENPSPEKNALKKPVLFFFPLTVKENSMAIKTIHSL